MEWSVVEVLIMLSGLFLSIGLPILRQSNKIQQIIDNVSAQQKELNTEQQLVSYHEKKINEHETRITILEHDYEENS